jgi:hypothetical protein
MACSFALALLVVSFAVAALRPETLLDAPEPCGEHVGTYPGRPAGRRGES